MYLHLGQNVMILEFVLIEIKFLIFHSAHEKMF